MIRERNALMVKAVLFDLFETLVTGSRTRPLSVSSLAPDPDVNERPSGGDGKPSNRFPEVTRKPEVLLSVQHPRDL